jgi:predicted RNase H-like HicB family nuclease
MNVRYYTAIVEGDPETGYSVFFPDLPGCTSAGASLQEAAANAAAALAFHARGMAEDGDALPPPTALDRIPTPVDPEVAEAARVLVPLQADATVSLDPLLLGEVDEAARRERTTRDDWIAQAARARLRRPTAA